MAKVRKIFLIFGIVVLLLIPPYVRTLLEARSYLEKAREAERMSTTAAAAELYAQAAAWRSPGNRWAAQAGEQLFVVASRIEDPEERLEALTALRSALKGSRSFLTDAHDPILEKTETQILALNPQAFSPAIKDLREPKVNFRQQLLAQLCFWIWIGAALAWVWRGFDRDGHLRWDWSLSLAGAAGAAYAAWLWVIAA